MPTTYHLADADVRNLLEQVMFEHHPRLHEAGVRVGVLFARNPDGPALKRNGYEVLAMIKPVPLKDRLTKGYDAELVIDGGEFETLKPRQQESTLHHELAHIDRVDLSPQELAARDEGDECSWKVDDLGRPKLRSVPGSWNAGDGHTSTVEIYGADAIEYELLARCKARADRARREAERNFDTDPPEGGR